MQSPRRLFETSCSEPVTCANMNEKRLAMKTILISAAGTASAYHLIEQAKVLFGSSVLVYAADINPRNLVPSALIADKYFTVPAISSDGYRDFMLRLIGKEEIDIYVPLIDADVKEFPADDLELLACGCRSTAPIRAASEMLSDKVAWGDYLRAKGLPIPQAFSVEDLPSEGMFFMKPRLGFGSRGSDIYDADQIRDKFDTSMIIQEVCNFPEITVEIFCEKDIVECLCRERLETKAGVCTKARIFHCEELVSIVKELAKVVSLPVASCVQFMMNEHGKWVMTDCNPRIGAGTALSSAIGWNLAAAALHSWLGASEKAPSFLRGVSEERFVGRVYKEVVMR